MGAGQREERWFPVKLSSLQTFPAHAWGEGSRVLTQPVKFVCAALTGSIHTAWSRMDANALQDMPLVIHRRAHPKLRLYTNLLEVCFLPFSVMAVARLQPTSKVPS